LEREEIVNGMTLSDCIDLRTAWKSERGFDYIAMADRNGRVQLFEAFYMQVDGCYIELQARILTMCYNLVARSLIVVTENGPHPNIPMSAILAAVIFNGTITASAILI
jgi:hypothetical protein